MRSSSVVSAFSDVPHLEFSAFLKRKSELSFQQTNRITKSSSEQRFLFGLLLELVLALILVGVQVILADSGP